jgi:hypothetical protein
VLLVLLAAAICRCCAAAAAAAAAAAIQYLLLFAAAICCYPLPFTICCILNAVLGRTEHRNSQMIHCVFLILQHNSTVDSQHNSSSSSSKTRGCNTGVFEFGWFRSSDLQAAARHGLIMRPKWRKCARSNALFNALRWRKCAPKMRFLLCVSR